MDQLAAACLVALAAPICSTAWASTDDEVSAIAGAVGPPRQARNGERGPQEAERALERRVTELEPKGSLATNPAPTVAAPPPRRAPVPQPVASRPSRRVLKGQGQLATYAVLDQHDPAVEDRTGFWIRRIISPSIRRSRRSGPLDFVFNPGDFTTNGKLDPFVKDAYRRGSEAGRSSLLAPTPTWDTLKVSGASGRSKDAAGPVSLRRLARHRRPTRASRTTAILLPRDGRQWLELTARDQQGQEGVRCPGFKPNDALVLQLYTDFEDRPDDTDRTPGRPLRAGPAHAAATACSMRPSAGADSPDQDVAWPRYSASGSSPITGNWWRVTTFRRLPDERFRTFVSRTMKFDLALLAGSNALQSKISLSPSELPHTNGSRPG